jgi:ATP-binding cassette subfamily F protein 3
MLRQQQIAFDKEQAERAHLQSFIDRFKAKASKAKQAQSRVKKLEKLKGTEAVRAEREFRIAFDAPARLPDSLLKLTDVEAGYRADSPDDHDDGAALAVAHDAAVTRVLGDVRFGLEAGVRIGLLGPNGEGKSTLVKTIAGAIAPLAGTRIAHKDLVIGYFAQHTVDQLKSGQTPVRHLQDIAPGIGEQVARNYLGRWAFAGDRVFESVDGFSGGERARLALALIAYTRPNLLLLDEPTNHLDLEMREALAEALNDYAGAIVLVSHDRSLLGLVCDSFWRVADGRVEPFDGDLDDYARWLRARRNTAESGSVSAPVPQVAAVAHVPAAPAPVAETPARAADRRRLAAEQREREKPLRQRIRDVEARMAAISAEMKRIETDLADPATFAQRSTADLARLARRQGELRAEHQGLEEQWLEASAALEALASA